VSGHHRIAHLLNPLFAKALMPAVGLQWISEDPVLFLEPKRIYRAIKEEVSLQDYTLPLGKAKIVQEGHDVTIIAYGAMVREAQRAAEVLQKQKVHCEIIDLRTISPLDTPTVIASVQKTGRCVVVHEGPRMCGVGAEIISRINEQALYSLEAPVERVTGFDTVFLIS